MENAGIGKVSVENVWMKRSTRKLTESWRKNAGVPYKNNIPKIIQQETKQSKTKQSITAGENELK